MKWETCARCGGRGSTYDSVYGSDTCYKCNGKGKVRSKKKPLAKVKASDKMATTMDLKKKSAEIRRLLKLAGVPEQRLPSVQHILSHFFDDWFDEDKMNKWMQDYSRLEGGLPPKTKKIKSKEAVTVDGAARKIELED